MTAIIDATAMIEALIGRVVSGSELTRIGNSFLSNDPYHLVTGWTNTVTFLTGATITDGGTGYTLDDILTVVGGTGTPSTLRVIDVDEIDGEILDWIVENQGAYLSPPNPSLTFTGGTGTGATGTAIGDTYEDPRDPTSEETAQHFMDTMLKFGQAVHRDATEQTSREAEMTTIDATVTAAGDVAVLDFT